MKKIDLGQTLSIVANVGVLAGILLLVYELNQTRELAQAQFEVDRDTAFQESELGMIGADLATIWEKAIFDPGSLSGSEIRTLDAFYAIQLSRYGSAFDLERAGFRPSGSTRLLLQSGVTSYFGNSFAQLWWRYSRKDWDSDFAELMDEVISSVDAAANKEWIERIQSDLTEFTAR
jgi:hypothetical protein